MPNVASIIARSNKSKLTSANEAENPKPQGCNCDDKLNCPVEGECQREQVIYRAEVKTKDSIESYIGLTGGSFKGRYGKHKSSFKKRDLYTTTLSTLEVERQRNGL